MSAIIEVRELTKMFGEIPAVDHLDFTVQQGEIYGFLGQNGAGKSTTIRMLLSLINPSKGEIKIFGLPLKRNRKQILKRIGAMIEKPDLYKYLSAFENLRIFARWSGINPTNEELTRQLEAVGLKERVFSKVRSYSQGMRQRLGIAVALVNDPDLIILDEPLNGLDPQGIADIRRLITYLSREKGKTIFISSHLLSEMELVADSLLIIHKGKKVAEGKMETLINPEYVEVEIDCDSAENLFEKIKDYSAIIEHIYIEGQMVIIKTRRESVPAIIKIVSESGIPAYSIRPRHNLENYFLNLTAK